MYYGELCSKGIAIMWVLVLVHCAGCTEGGKYHIYWGDVHGHTTVSDGKRSVDNYFTYARDVAKLDFTIVTDHDFGNGKPGWWLPKKTWQYTQDRVDAFTKNGRFIAIAGYEWTSQCKYWKRWSDHKGKIPTEGLFDGVPKFYNHKNVYFPKRVDYIFSSKDPRYNNPNSLAKAVTKAGGLIQNNHPSREEKNQWDYDPDYNTVFVNTEINQDLTHYNGKLYKGEWEQQIREYLNKGGKTGFVKGTDTHESTPEAKTAVLAKHLTRKDIFDALRHRRNYAITNARIIVDFRINGHYMGEEIIISGKPQIAVSVRGTAIIAEAAIIRNGKIICSINPARKKLHMIYCDKSFKGKAYYYLRVIQDDADKNGDPSYAWSSPIWVTQQQKEDYACAR